MTTEAQPAKTCKGCLHWEKKDLASIHHEARVPVYDSNYTSRYHRCLLLEGFEGHGNSKNRPLVNFTIEKVGKYDQPNLVDAQWGIIATTKDFGCPAFEPNESGQSVNE